MARRTKKLSWPLVLLVVLASGLWLKDEWAANSGGETGHSPILRSDRYESFEGCRWVDHRQNDGDSFRVKLPDGRVIQVRLYFVDAPESAFKSYGGGRNNHKRIGDQARDMGVSSDRAVEIGVAAKKRVHGMLAGEEFTLLTEWDDPFGDKRYHGFVALPQGGWLHEQLVEEGLVRIHTKGADLPGGRGRSAQERHLKELERAAKQQQRGVWSRS